MNIKKEIKNNDNKNILNMSNISWSLLQELQVKNEFKNIFNINDEIQDKYIDLYGNQYMQSWIIADFKKIIAEDECEYNAVIFQAKYAFPDELQFDTIEFTNLDNNRKKYGNNNYSQSSIRQYINSDKDIGEWWTPQHEYDITPLPMQLNILPGLLKGFSEDFRNILKPIKIITEGNNIENNQLYITYDKLWLPSLKEMNCNIKKDNIEKDNNLAFEYWKNIISDDIEPFTRSNHNIKDLSNNVVSIWTRSCYSSNSCNVWYFNTCGSFTSHYACMTCKVIPAFALF